MPTSNSCVKTGQGSVAMQTVPYPDTPGPGQAVIKTTLATICGSDIHIVDHMPVPPGLPMGHEAVGVVHAVGDGVTAFKAGDRVVVSCFQSCGTCRNCQVGDLQLCLTFRPSNLVFGGQGEYFLINGAQASMARIPDNLEDEQVIFATDIMSTGFAAIERAEIKPGDSVAIFAQGPVGLCATAGARTYGAGLIIGVESIPERVAMAKRLGADVVVDPKNAVAEIMNLTGGQGVDIAVEALGQQVTFENACNSVRSGGTISSVGVYSEFSELKMPTGNSFMHRKLITTLCPVGTARLERMMALVATNKVDLRPLLTHNMKISETPAGYDLFRKRDGGVLKIGLRP